MSIRQILFGFWNNTSGMGSLDFIDIFFIIMATFGFYFGFTFGLMRVILTVLSLFAALLAAMFLTPVLTNLLIEVMYLRSPYIPFVSFSVCVIMVFLMAKILVNLIEESVEKKKFNRLSQLLGGGSMALVFTIFYMALISFFGASNLVDLIYNDDQIIAERMVSVQLVVPRKTSNNQGYIWLSTLHENKKIQFSGLLRVAFHRQDGRFKGAYIRAQDSLFYLKPNQSYRFNSNHSMQLFQTNKNELCCFCDSDYIVTLRNNQLFFDCTDGKQKSFREGSLLYPYIQKVPEKSAQLLEGLWPIVDEFINFMRIAIAKLNQSNT